VLIVYRKNITAHEDDTIHILEGDQRQVEGQAVLAKRVDKIDLWGKVLTVITVVYGLALIVIYIYVNYVASDAIRLG
jgi:cell division protein FtsL